MKLDVAMSLLVAALVGACASDVQPASGAERLAYLTRRGTLAAAETTRVAVRGRYVEYGVRLASSTGMALTGRLLVPSAGTPPFAAVLLNDGRELNSRAVDALPRDFGDVVALVATSFAVPFAVIAASLDSTFREVALIYGAGDFAGVLAANLTLRPAWLRTPAAQIAMHAFAEFEPARYVAAIAPRRLLMVNGIDDPQMPASAVQSLYAAAGEPKSIVWLRTGHLMPDDSTLIRALVDTTLARLPVLHPQ